MITDTIGAQRPDPTAPDHPRRRSWRGSRPPKPVAELYGGTFGITRSHSRPRVSDDNPYSEAGFKTLEYRARLSRSGSTASKKPSLTATDSSGGTTSTTTTGAWRCSPPPRSSSAKPTPSSTTARACSNHRPPRSD
ncbi:MAG: hypothetical protein U5R31_05665, partial [Acidimicrobiia bacterium]|nr:hypothetical protein [Acidimicrobiia bacterium]